MNFKEALSNHIYIQISGLITITKEEIFNILEVPSVTQHGDFAFPCFRFAKELKKAPNIIASELSEKLKNSELIEKIEVVNAYINFHINKSVFVKETILKVLNEKENFGSSKIGDGKNIVIDYSSPNIAKPFHIGHLRSTVIGNSLYKIFNKLGYSCIGINHLGDWGTQFGKLIVAYKNWGDKEKIEKDDIKELSNIYVKFHEESEKNPDLEDEAREYMLKMQNKDEEALYLWKWFCEISMKEFERIYKKLNISFDHYTGESFYNDKMDSIIEILKSKNLLIDSNGAKIVDLEKFNMPPCLILRSDGGTLYATRDITTAIYRKNTYDFEKCIYLTAIDQNLHFEQFFKVIELMGYDWAKDLHHIPFGLVSLGDSKLSTRKGNVVLMEDILNSSVEKTKQIIEEKNPSLKDKDLVANQVGIGAIIFNDLYNSRIKNVTFDLEKMLNFEGETGPYVQYTHTRACSILNKENFNINNINKNIDFNLVTDEYSFNLCKLIATFPEKIQDAANKYEPYIISRHIIDICQAFNKFYNENNIKNSEENLKYTRLLIVYITKIVISMGLSLLGIDSPEKM